MNHLHTIIISLGLAILIPACSLTPPSPSPPEGEYRPVNKPTALNPFSDSPDATENRNGDAS